jgi:hypothetical protein
MVRLDAKTGQGVWTANSVPYDNFNPKFALGLDHIYFTEHWPSSDWRGAAVGDVLYSVDLLSGQVKPVYSAIRLRYYCGTGWTHGQSRLSDPIIDSDGSVVAVLSVTQAPSCTLDAKLYLLRIAPDGPTTVTQFRELSTSANGLVDPRQLIPDGQGEGGVLVSWDDTDVITRVTASGASDYDLEMETDIEEMILGENDVAYATDQHKLVAFDVPSGQVTWSYNAAPGSYVNMIASAKEEGLAAKVTTSGVETVVRFDAQGETTTDSWSAVALDYHIGDLWVGFASQGGVPTGFVAGDVLFSGSAWFMPGQGNTSQAAQNYSVDEFSNSLTDANQIALRNVLEKIWTMLPDYALCDAFLYDSIAQTSGVTYIDDVLLDPNYIGHGKIRRASRLSPRTSAFAGSRNPDRTNVSGIPTTTAITVNDDGAFFHDNFEVGIPKYPGNTARARATIVIHELGHLLRVANFQSDNGKEAAGTFNDHLVDLHCRALIGGPWIQSLSPESGSVTTTVTITGDNFGDSPGTVKFNNNITATPTSWNDSQIVVAVPSGATTGNIVVTVNGLTASKYFTVQ